MFQPDDTDALVCFWRREYERQERFKTASQDFIQCYQAEKDDMQPWFFLRKYYIQENFANARIYDADVAMATNGNWLVATLFALEKYKGYAEIN